jgi:multimeric flavodoxin WrbA
MYVVAISGSARREGNTALLLKRVLAVLEREGMQTELVQLAGETVGGCTACLRCRQAKDGQCHGRNDAINRCIALMARADGILIGSPVYFSDLSTETKALIDRAGYVGMANDFLYRRKVGAAVVAVRRGGAVHAFDSINHFFLISQMIIPGSSYWNMGFGREKGEAAQDAEGLRTMDTLGENMAWLLQQLHHHPRG